MAGKRAAASRDIGGHGEQAGRGERGEPAAQDPSQPRANPGRTSARAARPLVSERQATGDSAAGGTRGRGAGDGERTRLPRLRLLTLEGSGEPFPEHGESPPKTLRRTESALSAPAAAAPSQSPRDAPVPTHPRLLCKVE